MSSILTLARIAVCAFTLLGGQPLERPDAGKPEHHELKTVQGWKVRVDNRLLEGEKAPLGARAIERLGKQLSDIYSVMPKSQLMQIQQVEIWLDLANGDLHSPQYHPSVDWLTQHGYDSHLARCVHIPDAAYFVNARFQREQPFAVLHELAHAYHDQVLGFEKADIAAAYRRFVASGKYRSVLHISGVRRPHYALTDQKEFFAEMTESYFGANDFYPFNSAELRQEEPELYNLLQSIWGKLP